MAELDKSYFQTQMDACASRQDTYQSQITRLKTIQTSAEDLQDDLETFYKKVKNHCNSIDAFMGSWDWEGQHVKTFKGHYSDAVKALDDYVYTQHKTRCTQIKNKINELQGCYDNCVNEYNSFYSQWLNCSK